MGPSFSTTRERPLCEFEEEIDSKLKKARATVKLLAKTQKALLGSKDNLIEIRRSVLQNERAAVEVRNRAALAAAAVIILSEDEDSESDSDDAPAEVIELPTIPAPATVPAPASPEPDLKDCAICLDSVFPDQPEWICDDCHNPFHSDCILQWTNANTSCPLCRKPADAWPASDEDEPEYGQRDSLDDGSASDADSGTGDLEAAEADYQGGFH